MKNWCFAIIFALIFPVLTMLCGCNQRSTLPSSNDGQNVNNAKSIVGFEVYIDDELYSSTNNTIVLTYGQSLNLEERVTLKRVCKDNAKQTLTFKSEGVEVSSLGQNLPANSEGYDFEIKYLDFNPVFIKVVVLKAIPAFTIPENLNAEFGQSLSDITLPKGFNFENENTILNQVGSNVYYATFTPQDTQNYETVNHIEISVNVAEPEIEVPTGLVATYGDKLFSVKLPSSEFGEWSWNKTLYNNEVLVGNAGIQNFEAVFYYHESINLPPFSCEVSVVVNKKEIAKPYLENKTYYYNAQPQTASLLNFEESLMEVENNTRTDAGKSVITVSLTDPSNYMWQDGSLTSVSIEWEILKAKLTLALNSDINLVREYNGSNYFKDENELFPTTVTSKTLNKPFLVSSSNGEFLDYSFELDIHSNSAVYQNGTVFFLVTSNGQKESEVGKNQQIVVRYKLSESCKNFELENADSSGYVNLVYNNVETVATTPEILELPSGTQILSGQTLNYSILSGGKAYAMLSSSQDLVDFGLSEVAGRFSWANGESVVTKAGWFDVVFTPTCSNFKSVTIKVEVNVKVNEQVPSNFTLTSYVDDFYSIYLVRDFNETEGYDKVYYYEYSDLDGMIYNETLYIFDQNLGGYVKFQPDEFYNWNQCETLTTIEDVISDVPYFGEYLKVQNGGLIESGKGEVEGVECTIYVCYADENKSSYTTLYVKDKLTLKQEVTTNGQTNEVFAIMTFDETGDLKDMDI